MATAPSHSELSYETSRLEDLAAYLRDNPEAAAEGIAEQFDLPLTFVEEVLGSLHAPSVQEDSREAPLRLLWDRVTTAIARGRAVFAHLTQRPLFFIAVSSLVAAGLFVVLFGVMALLPNAMQADTRAAVIETVQGFFPVIAGSTLILHLLCFARHGELRVPFRAGLVLATLVFVGTVVLLRLDSAELETLPVVLIVGVLLGVVVGGLYFGAGAIASLIGGYLRVQQRATLERKLTRQELLERLFELQARLRAQKIDLQRLSGASRFGRLRETQRYLAVAALAGAALGFFEVSLLGTTQAVLRQTEGPLTNALDLLIPLVTIGVFIAVAYLAGNVRKAMAAVAVTFAFSIAPRFLPYGGYGPQSVMDGLQNGSLLLILAMLLILGVFSGLAAFLEDQAYRHQRLASDEPAAIVAEVVRIQRRLSIGSQLTCVMVVDVAKSTRMKMDADPLLVEWSFRAYQDLVERICEASGGEVISTAGDGAVAAFGSCVEALRAARTIHSEVTHFNARQNRLRHPFRLRIGLHVGRVESDLNTVQFNEVIDIAAHVEESSPVGGIAVTQDVADQLPDEKLAQISAPIDGRAIYFVLNPTLQA